MENQARSNSLPSTKLRNIILGLACCAISLYLIYLVYARIIIFGSAAGHWVYPYFQGLAHQSLWIPVVVILLLVLSVFGGSKLLESHPAWVLVGFFVIGVGMQILIQQTYPFPLQKTVISDTDNSFYSAAKSYSPIEVLSEYISLTPHFPLHAKSNMPGKILFYQFLELFTSSPQVLGYLVITISSLGGLLLYAICLKLFADRRTGFYAFVLYVLMPSKLFFFPLLNTVTPLFILLCLYLFLIFIERKNFLYLVLLGVALYLLVLFEPSPLFTGLIFIAVLLHAVGEKRITRRDLLGILIVPLLSFLAVYLLMHAIFRFNLLQIVLYVFTNANQFNAHSNRSYWVWLLANPKEFFYGLGLPVGILFIYLVARLISQLKTIGLNLVRWPVEHLFLLSTLLTFLIVWLIGVNRGEVTRLWIYLAVFFQVPVAYFMAKIARSTPLFFLLSCMLVLQVLITLPRVQFVVP